MNPTERNKMFDNIVVQITQDDTLVASFDTTDVVLEALEAHKERLRETFDWTPNEAAMKVQLLYTAIGDIKENREKE
jgi:hypothetical protein